MNLIIAEAQHPQSICPLPACGEGGNGVRETSYDSCHPTRRVWNIIRAYANRVDLRLTAPPSGPFPHAGRRDLECMAGHHFHLDKSKSNHCDREKQELFLGQFRCNGSENLHH